ncbi:hypothetical protein A2801_04320 [Candidatus Woesebacteria bacterium RIFCSPHIGHO2_01_FULL_41_10]|uniref:Alpha/beta hydrolase n=1 Tax=Candidatus Woesebacteria bacterium RIFCSPHIGHO2_01_FULL_41_10 TaxID=1802500 RepID=A0A1F7YLQ5_9BACT|nr:MAG: hypothetical protein A2801_04320 [Candidatus Woesebacteria bacterium RIFCSPHIGHO2_01_FULL_41_10]
MKTIILPGFSSKNKEWAGEVKKHLKDSMVYEWKHWKSGNSKDFSASDEAMMVMHWIAGNPVNIIAKSIGTIVTMYLLRDKCPIEKLILCGMPLADLEESEIEIYKSLSEFDAKRVIVLQNKDDNHGSFKEVSKLLGQLNNKIKLIEKSRSDHEYPYFEEFVEFLTSG